jgi:adenylate cyclase class IV
MMLDRRYDREGTLVARDEVLRLRVFRHADGRNEAILGWKGPTGVSPEGYKARRELEFELTSPRAEPEALLEALGYRQIETVERYVEFYHLGDTDVRLEWYPRMDVLIEVEGSEAGIESALSVIGLPRDGFTPEPLRLFAERYGARTGRTAALAIAELGGGEAPSWDQR